MECDLKTIGVAPLVSFDEPLGRHFQSWTRVKNIGKIVEPFSTHFESTRFQWGHCGSDILSFDHARLAPLTLYVLIKRRFGMTFTCGETQWRVLRRVAFPGRAVSLRTKLVPAAVKVRFQTAAVERPQVLGCLFVRSVHLRPVDKMCRLDHLRKKNGKVYHRKNRRQIPSAF